MSGRGILDTFASHAFLQKLSERHLMTLASGARPFVAAVGELLGHEGLPANVFYLIQSGVVALETQQSGGQGVVRIQTVGPGEVIGWSWLVPPYQWQFDARAVEAVRGLAFDAAWLRDQCEQDHELGYHLLKALVSVIANRLAASRGVESRK
jgi:CRP/FNR family transcriptional regulator, cyclic AMP receptor protein